MARLLAENKDAVPAHIVSLIAEPKKSKHSASTRSCKSAVHANCAGELFEKLPSVS